MLLDRSFWYRQTNRLIIVVSFLLTSIWPISLIQPNWLHPILQLITPVVSICALVTLIVSLAVFARTRQQPSRGSSFLVYMGMVLTSLILLMTTGHFDSPYIVLWMITISLAGLYRYYGLISIGSIVTAYTIYAIADPTIQSSSYSKIIISILIPAIISFLIWRRLSSSAEPVRDYSALAHELDQVSNKAEIILNAIADGVVAINNAGTIQIINPAAERIMGWGKQDALELDYRSVFRLTDDKDRPLAPENDPVQKVLLINESITSNDFTLLTANGKKMIISLLVSPLGPTGSGAIIVFRDITSEVLENRQKAEFISTASHEMRTPVAAIEGYISLALNPDTATIDEKARSYLQKAHESAAHLGQLFQDLLDVSKAEDGRISNNPVSIDVTSFIRDLIGPFQSRASEKGLSLSFVPDVVKEGNSVIEPIYYVSADPSHLREVISNLVENAIKYTKEGSVTIDVGGDSEHVMISVVDTGIGIPAEDIPHLFQKFYRVDNTDTREIGGTGLGLYLCRRLVETMNGRIWIESDYSKGSMFFVELNRIQNDQIINQPPRT